MKNKTINMINSQVEKVANTLNITSSYKIMGSNSYRGSLYGSDIDLFTNMKGTKEEAIWIFFKKLFIKQKEQNTFLFMDFKAGLDNRLVYNDGDKISKYVSNPLIPTKIKKEILNTKGDIQYNLIRSLYVLRWTADEIIDGKKTLIDGTTKSFVDALEDDTIIKLDVAIVVNNLFVDLTEVYSYKKNPVLKKQVMKELEMDINKYFRSSTMKSLKRLYSYLNLTNKKIKLQRQLLKLFNSPMGYANKLMNDILFFIDVCNKHDIPFDVIKNNGQMFKEKYFSIDWSNKSFVRKLNGITQSNYIKVFKELVENIRTNLNPLVKKEFEGME